MLGCGYTLVGQGNLPDHINTIAIPVFTNDTLEEGIEETLTNAVIEEFIRGGKVRLVSESRADAILLGTIRTYTNKQAIAYNDLNEVAGYRLTVTVDLALKDLVEDVDLWTSEGMEEFADYEGGADTSLTEEQDNEREAMARLSEKLAQEIRALSTEGF
jgi:hypothetical protein